MQYGSLLTTPDLTVTVAELKAHLSLNTDQYDDTLEDFIRAAEEYIQGATRRQVKAARG